MALILLTSLSGSPGVTTAAVGLTMAWQRPVLLLEADLSKPSGVLPGFLRGQWPHDTGLAPLTVTQQRGELTPRAIQMQTKKLGEEKYLIPGFRNVIAGAGASTAFWGALASQLSAMSGNAADVIVDAGRWAVEDGRAALMRAADITIVVARAGLPDIATLHARRDELTEILEPVGRGEAASLLLVQAQHEPFSESEIRKHLNLPVLGRLANDPRTAAVYSDGAELTPRARKSALQRDLTVFPTLIHQAVRSHREKLGTIPTYEGERP